MRHLAWLGAVPRDKDAAGVSTKAPLLTRLERDKKQGIVHDMPPCPSQFLVSYLMEIGPMEISGESKLPISHREIHYWQQNSGVRLSPWQSKLLRRLSAEFVAESRRAEDPDCVSPLGKAPAKADLALVDRQVEAMLSLIAVKA